MSTLPNKYAMIWASLLFLLTGCSNETPEPIYETKKSYSSPSFGPGLHMKLDVYKNVKGWTDGKEPDWFYCKSLSPDYEKIIVENQNLKIESEKIKIYILSGDVWMTSYIELPQKKGQLFKVTEWDDHSNYQTMDLKKIPCNTP